MSEKRIAFCVQRLELHFVEAARRRGAGVQRAGGKFHGGLAVFTEQGACRHHSGSRATDGVAYTAFAIMPGTADSVRRKFLGPRRERHCRQKSYQDCDALPLKEFSRTLHGAPLLKRGPPRRRWSPLARMAL